jgi:hypothetical protein
VYHFEVFVLNCLSTIDTVKPNDIMITYTKRYKSGDKHGENKQR